MVSTSPALLELFRATYFKTAAQKQSALVKSGVMEYDNRDGALHNFERILSFEVSAISSTNQASGAGTKTAWSTDNRAWYSTVYYAELLMDKQIDVEKAITDPKSALMQRAVEAGNRQVDRTGFLAAGGSVSTGAPETTKSPLAFTADGGRTINCTGGITEALLRNIRQNFANMAVDDEDQMNAAVFITGSEEKAFLALDHLINRLYTSFSESNKAAVRKLFDTYNVFVVPGSDAQATITNPVLPESEYGVRSCFVIAPGGLVGKVQVKELEWFPKLETYLNSQMIRFKIEIGAMRTEGARVQLINTTIES